MGTKLAIVIPAYKTAYLDAALASLTAQTNQNFFVYVADDGSPENIGLLVDKYQEKLVIKYYRFPDNLGSIDLAGHWDRSVALAIEPWVWLFSDDDLLSPACVQRFYEALEQTGHAYNLYRFNIDMIDGEGKTICVKKSHPELESAYEFLIGRLKSRSLSAAVEYIFRKDVFVKYGGFVSFPSAYCSDDASWLLFADEKPIFTIHSEKVYWRASGINISSGKKHAFPKAIALLLFIQFITINFGWDKRALLLLARPWFFEQLNHIQGRITIGQAMRLSRQFKKLFKNREKYIFRKIIAWQYRYTRFARLLQLWSAS
ncbi:glycosyltransferase family 2 protein [Mucilaginibacter sp.]|uniref:glycosyltransferase family 2 protein n=1 Tax=Mucilaginibacter sp. TaxID=1882438 RepID=UPI0035BC81FD